MPLYLVNQIPKSSMLARPVFTLEIVDRYDIPYLIDSHLREQYKHPDILDAVAICTL